MMVRDLIGIAPDCLLDTAPLQAGQSSTEVWTTLSAWTLLNGSGDVRRHAGHPHAIHDRE